ncbi:organic cation transporter protein-like [Maniola jurtina]|uniref:organic cation transporter protein-like n=1 Tax=Maniola jurtina TaxID=191418 RepID=UPI001E68E5EF|nr:organic cation transporter protein-like [Maniola jurtina]
MFEDKKISDEEKRNIGFDLKTITASEVNAIGAEDGGSVYQKPFGLDDVLATELGQFGWFQMRNMLLAALPIILCGMMNEYIFSAAAIPHRCRIPECGENEYRLQKFAPEWIKNSIPESDTGVQSCERYAPINVEANRTLEFCPAILFNKSKTIPCDSFVYATDNTVVYEFDLGCQEWLRALAGTLNSLGTLFVLPITGYISDRFGRRTALIISVFNMGLFGAIRAFSVSYPMYLALQFLQSTFGAGAYSSAYIFVAELVGPKYRVLASAASISLFAIGEVLLGSVAWVITPWRAMIMAIHIPCFIIVVYYWLLTESVRWLLSKKKFPEAKVILETVAKVNKTYISEKSLKVLMSSTQDLASTPNANGPGLVRTIIRSPVLLRRVCTTPVWWITTTFVFYGLSINSTGLSDTKHLNFILTALIEIPGYFIAALVLDKFGRRATVSMGFFFSAACNIVFVFVPKDHTIPRLITYLLGKLGISVVALSLYLYTSELYPTEFRHTLLGFSSMIGRIGAITAPLTPVLMTYYHGIPSLLFGGMGVIAGLLVLTQPETLGCNMPDTLTEAEAIGKPQAEITSLPKY